MQTSVDSRVIDQRIAELTDKWMQCHDGDDIAASLQPTLQAVIDEGAAANRGGKRLRALLALAAFKAYGTECNHDLSPMLDLACAIEIYQTSALIHDDIIDDSPLRRGHASAHIALSQAGGPSNSGTGLALMLGNMLATASVDIAANALENDALHHSQANLHTFLEMQRAVEIGQSMDLGAETISLRKPDELIDASLNVFAWKTASYTTIAPLQLGLCAAGMSPETARETARSIGLPLGLAFQLADDLIDVVGTTENTGKPVGGDIREGKRTVLLADALLASDDSEKKTLINIYTHQQRDNADVRTALNLFAVTGAIETSKQRIDQLWQEVQTAINWTDLDTENQRILQDACSHFIPKDFQ
ncbi:polyprenyl synthetase family protein [Bifidobacterium sp. ESL0682]|uniref:polyprenyl synthetase family protein n=1 Tax=Bifidobacterium sp. ESL0682 TaxID=2983212 RepID=UPI0023F68C1B|nr:polyprenyl synthetase family protein [Bifidobacterium sp. ESL0682]WEV42741.1 polyprenyl synthetase family protein [Bifidobacterium sp. ESL0682]